MKTTRSCPRSEPGQALLLVLGVVAVVLAGKLVLTAFGPSGGCEICEACSADLDRARTNDSFVERSLRSSNATLPGASR